MQSNRKCVETLVDILETFSVHNYVVDVYLKPSLLWLNALSIDEDLYEPRTKDQVIRVKNFLKNTEEQMDAMGLTIDQSYYNILWAFVNKMQSDDDRYPHWKYYRGCSLENFFTEIVLKLEDILEEIYIRSKEKTIEKQLIIHKLLENKKCFDIRYQLKDYIFDDANKLHEEILDQELAII